MYPHARPPLLPPDKAHFLRYAGKAKSYETFPILYINYESPAWDGNPIRCVEVIDLGKGPMLLGVENLERNPPLHTQ